MFFSGMLLPVYMCAQQKTQVNTNIESGALNSRQMVDKVFKANKAAEKVALYNVWIEQYPTSRAGYDQSVHDYVISSIADAYAGEKNTKKAIEFIYKLMLDYWRGNGYLGLAIAFENTGDLKNAALRYKMAMESAKEYHDGKLPDEGFFATWCAPCKASFPAMQAEVNKYKKDNDLQ